MIGRFPPGFQWDEVKNKVNVRKHGIDFCDAVRVFENATWDRIGDRTDYGEVRTNSVDDLDGLIVINVTHTTRDGSVRLISARLATSRERTLYRQFVHELTT